VKLNDGEAVPLVILLSENSWVMGCAMAGTTATTTIASIAANIVNFLIFCTPPFQ
jgi:hypothetical protein